MVEFSIVTPIKDEKHLIPRTLPSYYEVNPDEVVLCFDKPPPKDTLKVAKKVIEACNAEEITKIIEVERSPEWAFHQANVRRTGFREATYDRILTTDIDLIINSNVLKAVNMIGKEDVGLVSCGKFRYPNNFVGFWRAMGYNVLRKSFVFLKKVQMGGLKMSAFTGLYAMYRPYWFDSEDEEGIKRLVNPKQVFRGETIPEGGVFWHAGEDTYLRDCMVKQHRVITLSDVGAICLTDRLEDIPGVQFEIGRYNATRTRSMLGAIVHVVAYAHPHYFRGFIYEKQKATKSA